MRSFDVVTSEVNHTDCRLQPQHGAALIQGDSARFSANPDIVVANANCFGFMGRSFKQSVHVFVRGLEFSRNHKALSSSKLGRVRRDGEPHNVPGLTFIP